MDEREIERILDDEMVELVSLMESGASLRDATRARLNLLLEEMLDEPMRAAGVGRKERRRRIHEAFKDPRFLALLPRRHRADESS